MVRVATPQPRQMPSSPAMMGVPVSREMLPISSALLAAVLSVGTYTTSLSAQAVVATADRSLESEKEYWVQVMPASSR